MSSRRVASPNESRFASSTKKSSGRMARSSGGDLCGGRFDAPRMYERDLRILIAARRVAVSRTLSCRFGSLPKGASAWLA